MRTWLNIGLAVLVLAAAQLVAGDDENFDIEIFPSRDAATLNGLTASQIAAMAPGTNGLQEVTDVSGVTTGAVQVGSLVSTGSMGIGAIVPSYLLDIAGADVTAPQLRIGNLFAQNLSAGNNIIMDNVYYNAGWRGQNAAAGSGFQLVGGEVRVLTHGAGAGGGAYVGSTTQTAVFDSSGKVGIGTSAPTSTLHVAGNVYIPAGNWYVQGAQGITNIFSRMEWDSAVGSNRWTIIVSTNLPSATTPVGSQTNVVYLAM